MGLYDEVEVEDMEWNDELKAFTYQCPCGDLFQISLVRCIGPLLCSRQTSSVAAALCHILLTFVPRLHAVSHIRLFQ